MTIEGVRKAYGLGYNKDLERIIKNREKHEEETKETYLILDETNKVVAEKATEKEAKLYIKHKPNLKYQEFEYEENNVACDLDEIL